MPAGTGRNLAAASTGRTEQDRREVMGPHGAAAAAVGAPLPPPNYCSQVNAAASSAKSAGIEIFTVGFGLDGSNDIACPDTWGTWQGKKATQLLASVADSSAADNGCPGTENTDGDHYFCVPKTAGASTDLSDVFKTAATALTGSSRLIQLP